MIRLSSNTWDHQTASKGPHRAEIYATNVVYVSHMQFRVLTALYCLL